MAQEFMNEMMRDNKNKLERKKKTVARNKKSINT